MTVPAYLITRVASSPRAAAFWRLTDQGWESENWESVMVRVRNLSRQLQGLGLASGDRVVLMMPTSIEWEICHLAALATGCVVVGIDAHDTQDNIRHILTTVAPRALFVTTQEQQIALENLLTTSVPITIVNALDVGPLAHSLPSLLTKPGDVPDQWPEVRPGQLATIIFTSGSTGRPKGIAYSHEQLCLACSVILERFDMIGEGARFACWLPLSNLFQRIINLCALVRGGETFFVERPTEIVSRLPEIRPSIFIGVPRFFEKLHAGIEENLAKKSALLRRGVGWALRIGMDYQRTQREGKPAGALLTTAYRFADAVFLSQIRKLAGPNLQFMVSGSAPLPVWLMESFHAMGWLVLEAYGTSEDVVPIAINSPRSYRFGSVGRPLPQNELKIAEDGELLIRGKGVFNGYLGDAAALVSLDSDGFLHTGDFVRLDEEGYLWLTGRKSEIFKTSTGRRIAPAPIESMLKRMPYVEHAVVMGRNQPVPVALLGLNPALMPGEPRVDEPLSEQIVARIEADVMDASVALSERDRPAGIIVTRRAFSIAGGELTSNLKLKRGFIEEAYRTDMDELYQALKNRRSHSQLLIREAS